MSERRKVKHAQFSYYVPTESVNMKTGKTQPRLARRIATQGSWIDIPRDEDVKAGDDAGAFYTEDELNPSVDAGDDETIGDDDIDSGDGDEPTPPPDQAELVAWIKGDGDGDKPTAPEVVARAGDDPVLAQALIEAENEASGNDPRSSVIQPLEKIASS